MKVINIQNMCKAFPNDGELGKRIRTYINDIEDHSNSFVKCKCCGRYQSYVVIDTHCKYCSHELKET